MKQNTFAIVAFAAVQLLAMEHVTAQVPPTDSPAPAPNESQAPPFGRPKLSEMLTRTLSLTDAQRAQLQPYIDAMQPQIDAVREQARQTENTLLKQLHAQIRSLLTTEQQKKLDALETLRAGNVPLDHTAASN